METIDGVQKYRPGLGTPNLCVRKENKEHRA